MMGVLSSIWLGIHLVGVGLAILVLKLSSFLITACYQLLPKPLLDPVWRHSKRLRSMFAFHLAGNSSSIMTAPDLIQDAGYPVEEHHCVTPDGFVLGIHRISGPHRRSPRARIPRTEFAAASPDKSGLRQRAGLGKSSGKPAVLLIHGLMMSSDVWVVSGRERSLGFALADAGYDVYMGNNRGNRYSSKHVTHSCRDNEYWDFSLDELARFDIPSMVQKVLDVSGQSRCAVIGFSQGTAQTFAALSQDHELSSKVSAFVALSPAVTVKGLSRSSVAALVSANENFIYLLFGRRRIFPSTLVWQRIMSTSFYVRVIDASMKYLFSWDVSTISRLRKPLLYNHIYSYSSVKSVVHWFQMIRSGRFQMFDDAPSQHRVPPQYDVRNITSVPIALFVGGRDTIIDADRLISLLPPATVVHRLPKYEHLCTMWSETAHEDVFPGVIAHLDRHCRAELSKSRRRVVEVGDNTESKAH